MTDRPPDSRSRQPPQDDRRPCVDPANERLWRPEKDHRGPVEASPRYPLFRPTAMRKRDA